MSDIVAPKSVKDADGDLWTLDEESGLYSSPGLSARTMFALERDYGPLSSAETDVRVLLAEALEDVARKLREAA